MTYRPLSSLALAAALSGLVPTACKEDAPADPVSGTPDGGAGLNLTFTDSPVTGLPQGARFASAVPYGNDPMQVVDVFLPAATAPTAAVLYLHGGGFTKGSRADAYRYHPDWVRKVLEAGVAWVSVEYRLLQPAGTEKEGVIKSLRDCQRALQFVRHSASSLNVDPTRVAANGSSAGAGASMWLAFHDDMAKADSADAVERESTRPQVIAVEELQATYNLLRWGPDILQPGYAFATNELFLAQDAVRTLVVQFYGLDAAAGADGDTLLAAMNTAPMLAYRADVDMLALLSSDDAPAYVLSAGADKTPLDPAFDLLHHPLHGKAVHARGVEVGATLEANVPAFEISSSSNSMDFILERLKR